ncbi:MAG: DUF6491 family protein [Caulobacterales bacterium]|jgi:hypothetical protein
MKTHLAPAAVAAALLALGATAAAAADKPAPRNQCFWARNVSSFAAPDNRTLYVRVGVNQVYRFDMFAPCQDMDWNQRLALVSRGGDSICSGMDAEVISHATGLGRQRCAVRNMRKLTPQEVAALPRGSRP